MVVKRSHRRTLAAHCDRMSFMRSSTMVLLCFIGQTNCWFSRMVLLSFTGQINSRFSRLILLCFTSQTNSRFSRLIFFCLTSRTNCPFSRLILLYFTSQTNSLSKALRGWPFQDLFCPIDRGVLMTVPVHISVLFIFLGFLHLLLCQALSALHSFVYQSILHRMNAFALQPIRNKHWEIA